MFHQRCMILSLTVFFDFNYAVAAVFSSVFLSIELAVLSFFFLSTLFASTSRSTNSIIAIGALSPYLNPALIILVLPPFLFSYLFDRVLVTLFADVTSCSFETSILVVCKVSFFPRVIILSACGFKNLAFGNVVLICSYLMSELSIFFSNALRCSEVLFNFLLAIPCLIR